MVISDTPFFHSLSEEAALLGPGNDHATGQVIEIAQYLHMVINFQIWILPVVQKDQIEQVI